VYNDTNVNITGGEIKAYSSAIGSYSDKTSGETITGTIKVSNGKLSGDNGYAILINTNEEFISSRDIEISGGELYGKNYAIRIGKESEGKLTISGGTIHSDVFSAIYNYYGNGDITIKGGTITSESGSALANRGNPKIEIDGGELSADKAATINTYNTYDMVIKGGTIKNTGRKNAILLNDDGKLAIEGGTITSQEGIAILHNGSGKLEIGKDDGTVSTTEPEVIGKTTGIKTQNGFDFYDGVLKGEEKSYDGEINKIPEGYELEEENELELKTIKLKSKTPTTIQGDINGDGKITATDLLKMKRYIVYLEEFSEEEIKRGDMNEDNEITTTDLLKVKRIIVGLE